jgi:hypothetical protein
MNKTRWVAILGTTLCAGLLPIASSAANINQRQHREQVRIRQGVRSGELTRAELRRLETQQARIRVDERLARRKGLTDRERERLQRELERASRSIHRQKNDRQDRN